MSDAEQTPVIDAARLSELETVCQSAVESGQQPRDILDDLKILEAGSDSTHGAKEYDRAKRRIEREEMIQFHHGQPEPISRKKLKKKYPPPVFDSEDFPSFAYWVITADPDVKLQDLIDEMPESRRKASLESIVNSDEDDATSLGRLEDRLTGCRERTRKQIASIEEWYREIRELGVDVNGRDLKEDVRHVARIAEISVENSSILSFVELENVLFGVSKLHAELQRDISKIKPTETQPKGLILCGTHNRSPKKKNIRSRKTQEKAEDEMVRILGGKTPEDWDDIDVKRSKDEWFKLLKKKGVKCCKTLIQKLSIWDDLMEEAVQRGLKTRPKKRS